MAVDMPPIPPPMTPTFRRFQPDMMVIEVLGWVIWVWFVRGFLSEILFCSGPSLKTG